MIHHDDRQGPRHAIGSVRPLTTLIGQMGGHPEATERRLARLEHENARLSIILLAILDEGGCLATDGTPEIPEEISGQFCIDIDLAREIGVLLGKEGAPGR